MFILFNLLLFSIYLANLFSKREIQSLLSLFALNLKIHLCTYPYINRIIILLAAAGITVLNESPIGPDHCKRRTPISVYAIGINTGGNTGEINTISDNKMWLRSIYTYQLTKGWRKVVEILTKSGCYFSAIFYPSLVYILYFHWFHVFKKGVDIFFGHIGVYTDHPDKWFSFSCSMTYFYQSLCV